MAARLENSLGLWARVGCRISGGLCTGCVSSASIELKCKSELLSSGGTRGQLPIRAGRSTHTRGIELANCRSQLRPGHAVGIRALRSSPHLAPRDPTCRWPSLASTRSERRWSERRRLDTRESTLELANRARALRSVDNRRRTDASSGRSLQAESRRRRRATSDTRNRNKVSSHSCVWRR